MLDVYNVNLIKPGDLVVDVGAAVGDFAILASRRTGPSGQVIAIEPNIEDYRLMEMNLRNNNCLNVIPFNTGLGEDGAEQSTEFRGRTFTFNTRTLASILAKLSIGRRIDFLKMDIEGMEVGVIRNDFDIIGNSKIIAIELHRTKQEVDRMLLPKGFSFRPLTKGRVRTMILKNVFLHPLALYKAYTVIKKFNPRIISDVTNGLAITSGELLVGHYIMNGGNIWERAKS